MGQSIFIVWLQSYICSYRLVRPKPRVSSNGPTSICLKDWVPSQSFRLKHSFFNSYSSRTKLYDLIHRPPYAFTTSRKTWWNIYQTPDIFKSIFPILPIWLVNCEDASHAWKIMANFLNQMMIHLLSAT